MAIELNTTTDIESIAAATMAQSADWSDFFNFAPVIEIAAAPDEEPADPVIPPDPGEPPVEQTEEHPFTIIGTAAADRFEFKDGYGMQYCVVDFDTATDVFVIDGVHFGIDQITIREAEDVDDNGEPTSAAITYDKDTGDVFVGDHWLANIINPSDDGSQARLTLTAENFIIV
jgi:hypothetical protein